MQETTAFVCLFDNSAGYTELNNTPHTRRTKTLALCLRHAEGMEARNTAMNILRELHRQFCSAILREMTRIREQMHYVDPRITMQETSRYLMPGTAVCIAELQITHYTDLRYRADEWEKE